MSPRISNYTQVPPAPTDHPAETSRLGVHEVELLKGNNGCFSQLFSRIWNAIASLFARFFGKKPDVRSLNTRVQKTSNSTQVSPTPLHVRTTGPHSSHEKEKAIVFGIKKADQYVSDIREKTAKVGQMSKVQIQEALEEYKISFWTAIANSWIMKTQVQVNFLRPVLTKYIDLLTAALKK